MVDPDAPRARAEDVHRRGGVAGGALAGADVRHLEFSLVARGAADDLGAPLGAVVELGDEPLAGARRARR